MSDNLDLLARKVMMKGYRLLSRIFCSQCRRPQVAWQLESSRALDEVYSFFDENSADVIARHARRRPCPPSRAGGPLAYCATRIGDRFSFAGCGVPYSWIYLSSGKPFPEAYAVEFEYTPHTVFREFLQIAFSGNDLDNRHRFVIRDNEVLEYEMFWHGLFATPVRNVPLSLELHRAATIRLEVVGDIFTFLVNGEAVLTVRDRMWRPRPTVGKLIFWNHHEPVKMNFELGEVRLFSPAGGMR